MYDANFISTGGYIAGKVKVWITLRLLAGGNSLGLAFLFDIYSFHCDVLMYELLFGWIIKTSIGDLDMCKYLRDKVAMEKVSEDF